MNKILEALMKRTKMKLNQAPKLHEVQYLCSWSIGSDRNRLSMMKHQLQKRGGRLSVYDSTPS